MNRKSVFSVAAVLTVFSTLGVLAALRKPAHFEYQRAASAAEITRVQVGADHSKNLDMGFFGRSCLPRWGTGDFADHDTPEGEALVAALADSYNKWLQGAPSLESPNGIGLLGAG